MDGFLYITYTVCVLYLLGFGPVALVFLAADSITFSSALDGPTLKLAELHSIRC